MSNKKPKPPRKIPPHKSKYSGNFIGGKEKSKLEFMLEDLMNTEEFKSSLEYEQIKLTKQNTREYFRLVRMAYTKYCFQ